MKEYEKAELIVVYGKLPEEYDDCSCFDELNFEDFEETNDDEYIPFQRKIERIKAYLYKKGEIHYGF